MRVVTPSVERVGSVRAGLGESAIWHAPDNAVLWVDIGARRVLHTHVGTGMTQSWDFPEQTGFVQPAADGSWLVGQQTDVLRFDPTSAEQTSFVRLEAESLGNRTNDAACDRSGNLWVGTMNLPGGADPTPTGSLYRVDSTGVPSTIDTGLYVPNGIAFSPDGTRAYWADTYKTRRLVWQANYDAASGHLGEKSIFTQIGEADGRPDGATVDADGCYWVAAVWGWQLLRYTPSSDLDLVVRLPVQRPSKLAFGGPDLKTIFITTISDGLGPEAVTDQPLAGHLLSINLGIPGLPPSVFGQPDQVRSDE